MTAASNNGTATVNAASVAKEQSTSSATRNVVAKSSAAATAPPATAAVAAPKTRPAMLTRQYWSATDIWLDALRHSLLPSIMILLVATSYYYYSNLSDPNSPVSLHSSISSGNVLLTRIHYELLQTQSIDTVIPGDNANRSSLLLAASQNQTQIVSYLLTHPNMSAHLVNSPDADSFTALHYCIWHSNHDMLRLLLNTTFHARGQLQIDAQSNNATRSRSALMMAAAQNDVEAMKLLYWIGGASPQLEDADGWSALRFAFMLHGGEKSDGVRIMTSERKIPVLKAHKSKKTHSSSSSASSETQQNGIDYSQFGQKVEKRKTNDR